MKSANLVKMLLLWWDVLSAYTNVLESSQRAIHEQKLRDFLRTLKLFGTATTKILKTANKGQPDRDLR